MGFAGEPGGFLRHHALHCHSGGLLVGLPACAPERSMYGLAATKCLVTVVTSVVALVQLFLPNALRFFAKNAMHVCTDAAAQASRWCHKLVLGC